MSSESGTPTMSSELEPIQESLPSKRGRKPVPKSERKIGRYVKCPCCDKAFYYDYRDKAYQCSSDEKKLLKVKKENLESD